MALQHAPFNMCHKVQREHYQNVLAARSFICVPTCYYQSSSVWNVPGNTNTDLEIVTHDYWSIPSPKHQALQTLKNRITHSDRRSFTKQSPRSRSQRQRRTDGKDAWKANQRYIVTKGNQLVRSWNEISQLAKGQARLCGWLCWYYWRCSHRCLVSENHFYFGQIHSVKKNQGQ